MRSMTKKRVDQLKKQQEDKISNLKILKTKTSKGMWTTDLNSIEKLYKKFIKNKK